MKPNELIVIAHNIRSLHNVGAIFRTADSLGVAKIFLTGYTGTPPDPRLAKVALGAENFVPWEKNKSAARVLKKLKAANPKLTIVGLENNVPGAKIYSLAKYRPKFPLALIVGEEKKGISKKLLELCDVLVEIPMHGHKESLNVSVAFGIACYALLAKKG
jgi:tRNA G18 (ribose-2'-O)-methylase SpoU